MPKRTLIHTDFSTLYCGNHRYCFQGQESDDEVKGKEIVMTSVRGYMTRRLEDGLVEISFLRKDQHNLHNHLLEIVQL